MEAALQAARALMPEDASEADEGKVIDVLARVEELRRQLRQAGLEPPEDIWSRRPSG
jgi:ribose 1,5-bisphosphokinase PhnN